jgi:acyl carrier protein
MEAVYRRIIDGIREVFPEAEGIEFMPESVLGVLPEWDSMAAVNLQTWLQEQFNLELPLEFLSDETKIEEIAGFIQDHNGIPA